MIAILAGLCTLAGAAFVLIAVTGYTWLESRRLQKDLARLEAQGIRRRSAGSTGDPT